jgi:hypothetical protein
MKVGTGTCLTSSSTSMASVSRSEKRMRWMSK